MPSTPSAVDTGATSGSSFRKFAAGSAALQDRRAHDAVGADQWHDQDRAEAGDERLVAQWVGRTLAQIGSSLSPVPVRIDELPEEIVRDWLTADGRARLEVEPKGDVGDNATLRRFASAVLAVAPEAKFAHYLMMIAALGEEAVTAPGVLYSDYENSVGTGQVHVWFPRPADGW